MGFINFVKNSWKPGAILGGSALTGAIIGNLISPGAGGIIGAGIGSGLGMTMFNFGQEKEQLDYMKWAQRQTWLREDTAVQRRVDDLIRAGLSPVLAAGDSAQTSAPVRVEYPTIDKSSILDSIVQAHQIQNLKEQNNLIKMQVLKSAFDIDRVRSQADLNRANAARQYWDYQFYRNYGLPTNASNLNKDISGLTNMIYEKIKKLKTENKNGNNKVIDKKTKMIYSPRKS